MCSVIHGSAKRALWGQRRRFCAPRNGASAAVAFSRPSVRADLDRPRGAARGQHEFQGPAKLTRANVTGIVFRAKTRCGGGGVTRVISYNFAVLLRKTFKRLPTNANRTTNPTKNNKIRFVFGMDPKRGTAMRMLERGWGRGKNAIARPLQTGRK